MKKHSQAAAVVRFKATSLSGWANTLETSCGFLASETAAKTTVDTPNARIATTRKLTDWNTFPKKASRTPWAVANSNKKRMPR